MSIQSLKNKIFIGGSVFLFLLLIMVLILVLWRVQNQKTTITQPKATGGGGCPTETLDPCLHKNANGQFDCCDNCDAYSANYNSSTGYCSAACGGGQCYYVTLQGGGADWHPSPNGCNTQSCTVIGSIQGIKYLMPGNQNLEPAISQTVTLDGHTFQTKNPYFFGNIVTGTHVVSVTVPTGYTVGYTLCYSNQDQCGAAYDPKGYHSVTPTSGNSVTVNVPNVASGYADLWWHFKLGSSGCSTSADCSGGMVCQSGTCVCLAGQSACAGSCVNTQTDNNNCGSCSHSCTTGQSCVSGSCVVTNTTANECAVCGGGNQNSCASGLHCSGTTSTVGVCVKNDGSSTCGTCSTDNDCLIKALVCVNGSCVESASSHLGCAANNTCVRLSGNGSNTDGCTGVGLTCTTGSTTSNEVDSCWGGGGTNGRCFDCNGDGVINILDFSCMRNAFGQKTN